MVRLSTRMYRLGAVLTLGVCLVTGYSIKREYSVAPEWSKKKADIYFVVDSSSSIWKYDYTLMLNFVADLVKGMDIGPDKTRVGLATFSNKFREHLPLANTRTKDDLIDSIPETPHFPGNGHISRAIDGIRTRGLSKAKTRKGVPHIAVLFTDGESRYKQLTKDNSTLAKKEGITMYTIGIGRDINKNELRNLASDPKDDYSFLVLDFNSFDTIKTRLMKSLSKVRVPQSDEGTCGKKDMADVVFVFDEFAMGQSKSKIVKTFIKSLLPELSINSGNIRIGVISKTTQRGDIDLGQYLTREDFVKGIDRQQGPTIISLVKKARLRGFQQSVGARSHAKKRIVLFLHGNVTDVYKLVDEARRATMLKKIDIFVVEIAAIMPKGSLEELAKNENYITHVSSMEHLKEKAPAFVNSFCRELN